MQQTTDGRSHPPNQIPCWLTPKQKHIAETLTAEGFWYAPDEDLDFVGYLEQAGEWLVGSELYFPILDAVCNGALFCCEFDLYDDIEAEYSRIKSLIQQAEREYNAFPPPGKQLSLF